MPHEKIAQKQPTSAGTEPKRAQQAAVDDAVDDSFPASDPPAWTTTGAKSVAARNEDEDAGAPALDYVRTASEASAAAERRDADTRADKAKRRVEGGEPSDSPKRQGDKLSHAVRTAVEEPGVKDEP